MIPQSKKRQYGADDTFKQTYIPLSEPKEWRFSYSEHPVKTCSVKSQTWFKAARDAAIILGCAPGELYCDYNPCHPDNNKEQYERARTFDYGVF